MGAQAGHNMNANSGNYNYFNNSGYAKVSFDGFINENYFQNQSQEKNLVQNLEIFHAIVKSPISYQNEAFIGLLLKSKYDGIGNRQPIDMSIALDISGSMCSIDGNDGKSRLTLAKESLKKLVSIMDTNDRMSLITFNHNTEEIFGLLNKEDISQKFLNDIDSIKARGGTDLVSALQASMKNFNFEEQITKEKRIILITDAAYNDLNDNLFNLFRQCVEERGIPITIMCISSESNLSLADKVCNFKGCNYFPICKSSDLDLYLVKNFKYIFFPICYDTKLTIKSENAQISKCFGGGNEIIDEYENRNNESAPSLSNEITFNLGSIFSSDILKINDKIYSKGGLILLKINPNDISLQEELKFEFTLEYKLLDNNKATQNYSYNIQFGNGYEYFSDNNMKKGISIYYFASVLNHIVETQNKRNNAQEGKNDENQKSHDLSLLETKQIVSDFLSKNFILEPDNKETKDNLNNYKKMMEERYTYFKKMIFGIYPSLNKGIYPSLNTFY
jgi:hypothetical protein